jgi:hypothetical protein
MNASKRPLRRIRTLKGIESIKQGSLVKIHRTGESFWTIVRSVEGDAISAVVNNELYCTDLHGLKVGDLVEFDRNDILDVFERDH